MKPFIIGKWEWMMDWCKERRLPPADNAIWKQAEKAYNEATPEPSDPYPNATTQTSEPTNQPTKRTIAHRGQR